MTWVGLGAVTLLALLLLARGFANASVATVKKALAWMAGGLGLVMLAALLISGRGLQAIWSLAFFAPLILQAWRSWRAARTFARGGQASPGQESRIATTMLEMVLHHDSGRMTGRVLAGRFAGADLADLALTDLIALRDEALRDDPESVPLLDAWLDRSHPDWREAAPSAPSGDAPLTRAEALALLGLAEGASAEEIRAAHRRLMRSAHPDRGGSAWLAARLNAARDLLLGA
ncbi:molecular chaperone DnaJ [Roseomonas alkaliterrae]|uniref:J domain-containing protein n=1 Tax=Neoroseomonas alkaliterrae TaxID=1452450 RepID=A0A840XS53_9PROT|nr:molecular chaperone DnaJ [Neoroseomonas alkaliterrae]MBB5690756.1 hypothetical protein [Neoroseomonas alkaliterrae]MBR0678464.1 molecular chaperone DnaJ [Neoroseomonas alkaliterrae]